MRLTLFEDLPRSEVQGQAAGCQTAALAQGYDISRGRFCEASQRPSDDFSISG
jgi:hypothetical protein